MNYYFTGIIILMLTALAFCTTPAYPRNEYLNSYPNECRTGEIDLSVSARQYDYDNYQTSNRFHRHLHGSGFRYV